MTSIVHIRMSKHTPIYYSSTNLECCLDGMTACRKGMMPNILRICISRMLE